MNAPLCSNSLSSIEWTIPPPQSPQITSWGFIAGALHFEQYILDIVIWSDVTDFEKEICWVSTLIYLVLDLLVILDLYSQSNSMFSTLPSWGTFEWVRSIVFEDSNGMMQEIGVFKGIWYPPLFENVILALIDSVLSLKREILKTMGSLKTHTDSSISISFEIISYGSVPSTSVIFTSFS